MSRTRHELGDLGGKGGRPSDAGGAREAKAGGSDKSQKIKLILAVSVLAVAAVLIVWQSGLLAGTPVPLAAQPGAELDDHENPDNPGEPAPKSNFSRQAQPLR